MNLSRFFRHLSTPGWLAWRRFKSADREAIRVAIESSEKMHRGELCFIAEGPMPLTVSLRDTPPRARAEQLFARFGIGETREASGILVYVQLVDQRVEILADRGIADRVGQSTWDEICREMESAFAHGAYRRGALEAIDRSSRLLHIYFPARPDNPNEIADRPILM
jgi:uncharacterized membrane protein